MTRHARLALAGVAFLLLAACFAGLIYLFSTYPVFSRPLSGAAPILWSDLPKPVVVHSNWTSFTAPQTIFEAVMQDQLLWAATDGGVVVWDWSSGTAVRFTAEHGLAENVLTSAVAGRDGALWFGTPSGGVSRFDGTSWRTFTTADGLPSNRIADLAVTADGMVWAATAAGVGQYDGRRWYSYTRARSFFQLPGEDIRALAIAPDGLTVWAATDQGAARFNGRRWESLAQVGSQHINDIRDVAVTPDGMVWAATPGGLKRYDGTRWEIFTMADGLASDDVRRVTAVPDNTVWLAYDDPVAGLTLFDVSGSIPVATTASVSLPALQVTAVLPGGLLLSVPGGLFYADDGGADRLFRAPADLPDHHLTGLAANDDVWAAGAQGVSRFDGTAWRTYTTTHGLASTAVSALTLDPNAQPVVALAAASQGVARFDAAVDRWEMVVCPQTGPPSAFVRAGLQTADGALWFATNKGLARTVGENWQTFTTANGLPSDNVQTLTLANGVLWAGTNKGLAYYQDGRWHTVLVDDMRALTSGPDGTLWFFNAAGLFRMMAGDQFPTPVPLPAISQVYDQLANEAGLWLATDGGVYFLPEGAALAESWQTFPTADEQLMGEATALAQTADGRVWAGTDEGLWRLEDGVWGLRPLPVLHNVPKTRLVVDADGSLLVGSYDGRVYRVTPDGVIRVKPTPLGNEHSPVSVIIPAAETMWVAHFGGGVSRSPNTQEERVWQRLAIDDEMQTAVVNSIAVDQGGMVWLGTDKGLLSIRCQEGVFCQFEQGGESPDWAGVLADSNGQIWGVNGQMFWRLEAGEKVRSGVLAEPVTAVAGDGAVWVVTESGLVRHAHGRRELISTEFITGEITALAPAANGVLWVGTTTGLFWYDGRVWTHLTAADGLAANQVTHIAVAADGTVWIGTAGGVSRFMP